MRGFFITATNTDRGKTLVTGALRLWLQKQGHNCLAMKPVQTGMGQHQLSPDLYRIYALDYPKPTEEQVYSDLESLLPWLQPYCYSEPCSPHLAAERDALPPANIDHIKHCAQKLLGQNCDILLVEGAGGLYVPIDRKARLTMADIACALGLPIILVAQSGLGAINDTCLSLIALQQLGLPIVGFLLNDLPLTITPQSSLPAIAQAIRKDNPKIIAEQSNVPYLGTLRCLSNTYSSTELLFAFEKLSGLSHIV